MQTPSQKAYSLIEEAEQLSEEEKINLKTLIDAFDESLVEDFNELCTDDIRWLYTINDNYVAKQKAFLEPTQESLKDILSEEERVLGVIAEQEEK